MKPMYCPNCTGRAGGCETCDGRGYVMVERFPDCRIDGCEREIINLGGTCAEHAEPSPFVLNLPE